MAKNIVLLSDGTGNSAGKLFKTNVWRIYEALDLTDPEQQVACYDDGVGTSTFLPLAMLGGALGFGLKRNVLRLYRFLCEHYEPGDRIYAFGFSRGAFTIRVLVALIADQGVIRARPVRRPAPVPAAEAAVAVAAGPAAAGAVAAATAAVAVAVAPALDGHVVRDGAQLRRLTRRAYRDFRRLFGERLALVRTARWLRTQWMRLARGVRHATPYDRRRNIPVDDIRFVGLWDTVDAYGLPIDELTKGVDRWIWPLSFPELELSPKVQKACHALSLDDERHTFHPVLWDETKEPQTATHVDSERISQVWFAGVHANVGGGYPNDALSGVSLEWMATEARKAEIRFVPELIKAAVAKRDPLGRIYDSRRGLAGYYRYNPRKIQFMTNGQVHEQAFRGHPKPSPIVRIDRPKIHESVFTRIEAAPDAYAPIGLPERYAVVTANGSIVDGAAFEAPAVAAQRVRAQEMVWNLVWYRRIVYFGAVAVSAILAFLPFHDDVDIEALEARGGASRLINFVGSFLPDVASPWIRYYAAAPDDLVVGLVMLGVALAIGRHFQSEIGNRMRRIWSAVRAAAGQSDPALPAVRGVLVHVRQHPYYHGSFAVFRHKLLPHAFGLLVLTCALAAGNRALFEAANVAGLACTGISDIRRPAADAPVSAEVPTNAFCASTGIWISGGGRYRVETSLDRAADGRIPVLEPRGFGATAGRLTVAQQLTVASASPFKRLWRVNWFVPVARIGEVGVEQIPLDRRVTEFTARNDGELFLFVNDAIAPLTYLPDRGAQRGWGSHYADNRGAVTVTVTRLETPAAGAGQIARRER